MAIKVTALGQSGYLFETNSVTFLVDPYLSDYVEEKAGVEFKRMIPPPVRAKELTGIDYVFCTHAHWDHCDPHTISDLLTNNPNLKVICTYDCLGNLKEATVSSDQIILADGEWHDLSTDTCWRSVPAAHTELEWDQRGLTRFCGFVFEIAGSVFYHAGDCIPHEETAKQLPKKIDWAFVPVNERNCYRNRQGIVGNMTVREALQWIEEINALHWVPTHWDIFPLNRTYPEEVTFLAHKQGGEAKINWLPAGESMEI